MADQACPLLLAAVGGELSDAAPVRKHAALDGGSTGAGGVAEGIGRIDTVERGKETELCLKYRLASGTCGFRNSSAKVSNSIQTCAA